VGLVVFRVCGFCEMFGVGIIPFLRVFGMYNRFAIVLVSFCVFIGVCCFIWRFVVGRLLFSYVAFT